MTFIITNGKHGWRAIDHRRRLPPQLASANTLLLRPARARRRARKALGREQRLELGDAQVLDRRALELGAVDVKQHQLGRRAADPFHGHARAPAAGLDLALEEGLGLGQPVEPASGARLAVCFVLKGGRASVCVQREKCVQQRRTDATAATRSHAQRK